jgi:hypothetical protein
MFRKQIVVVDHQVEKQKLNLVNSFSEFENVLYVNNGQNDSCIFGDEQAVCRNLFEKYLGKNFYLFFW